MLTKDPSLLSVRLRGHCVAFLGQNIKAAELGGVDLPPANEKQTGVDQFDAPSTGGPGGGPIVEAPGGIPYGGPTSLPLPPGIPNIAPIGSGLTPPGGGGYGPSGSPLGISPGGGFTPGMFSADALGNFRENPMGLYARLRRWDIGAPRRAVGGIPGRLPMPPQGPNPFLIAHLANAIGRRGMLQGAMIQ